jgi:hypothetical protein
MKRENRKLKLQLTSETIKALQPDALARVAGASIAPPPSTLSDPCSGSGLSFMGPTCTRSSSNHC